MSAVDHTRILARIERLCRQADLTAVSLSAPTEGGLRQLLEAIRRVHGDSFEVHGRVRAGPVKLISVEMER